MSANNLASLIRTKKDLFQTPNLYQYLGNEEVSIHLENFRKNTQDQEIILFYEFQGMLYFPVWFEFRSINNNLLYLFEEFAIEDFKTLKRILVSSLEKEEHYEADFIPLIYRTKSMPKFSHALPNFKISSEERLVVDEA